MQHSMACRPQPPVPHLSAADPTTNDAVEGVQPSPRGPGLVTFGPDRVMEFCRVRGREALGVAGRCGAWWVHGAWVRPQIGLQLATFHTAPLYAISTHWWPTSRRPIALALRCALPPRTSPRHTHPPAAPPAHPAHACPPPPPCAAPAPQNNDLQMIVRAHECVMDGFERFAQGHLITLFSATNYCGTANNAGAILVLGRDLVRWQPGPAGCSGWLHSWLRRVGR